MVRRVALIIGLSGFLAVLLVIHVRTLLGAGPAALFPMDIRKGEAVVGDITGEGVFSPFERYRQAGLKKGDVVEAAYTADGEGGRVDGLLVVVRVVRAAGAAGAITLHLRRPSEDNRRLDVVIPPRGDVPRDRLFLFLGWTVFVPLAALTAALLLGLLKPEDPRAFVGSLMFLSLAGGLALDALTLPMRWAALTVVAQMISTFASNLLFVWFFLVFPTASLIERRLPWFKYAALVCTVIMTAVSFAQTWAALTSLETFERYWSATQAWLPKTISLVSAALTLVGIASLVLNTRGLKTRDERRRMLIVLVGTLVGLGPLLIAQFYYSVRQESVSLSAVTLIIVLLPIFPISFVYAVVRHRVLGARLILRRGVQYALVSAGFQLLLAAILFALFMAGFAIIATPFTADPIAAVVIAAGLAFVSTRLFGLLSRRVKSDIDRRFFRDAYDAQVVLSSLSHSIRQLVLDRDRLLNEVVDAISAALHPQTAAIFIREAREGGESEGAFHCAALRREEGDALDARELVLPAAGALATRLRRDEAVPPVRALDLFLDEPRGWVRALVSSPAHAAERTALETLGVMLAVPITAGVELVGVLLLGDKRSQEHYSRDDKELLATVAEQVGLALDYGQLARQAAREESLRKEVEIARTVQARLFPQSLPPVAGVDYSGICRPAREVGGDSYDFIAIGTDRLGLSVGDISGKGVAAALLMASLQALLRSHAPLRGDDLRDLIADINRLLAESIPDNRFATFFYGVLDPARRRLTYVNAGHNPPMLLRDGDRDRDAAQPIVRLEPTGTMLGMFTDIAFDQRVVEVASGDVLIVYSDGICDALNPRGEDYGDERLAAVVRAHARLPAATLQERILDDVAAFGNGVAPFDDMTLVVAKVL